MGRVRGCGLVGEGLSLKTVFEKIMQSQVCSVVVVVAVAGWKRGECVVNLSRGSREDFVLIILIVKLRGPVGPQP